MFAFSGQNPELSPAIPVAVRVVFPAEVATTPVRLIPGACPVLPLIPTRILREDGQHVLDTVASSRPHERENAGEEIFNQPTAEQAPTKNWFVFWVPSVNRPYEPTFGDQFVQSFQYISVTHIARNYERWVSHPGGGLFPRSHEAALALEQTRSPSNVCFFHTGNIYNQEN